MLDLGKLRIGIVVDSAGAKQELNAFAGDVDSKSNAIGGKFSKLGSKLKTAFVAAAAAAAAAVGAAVVKITKDAVKAYAEFEQLEGGVKKIFGDKAAQTVMDNAQKAFRTAGISANEYMEQATSFSASLIQSLNGDTQKAAQITDMAIKDMSDNANTFGTDIASIQNAYQGFAKQNYTMLDNLKLGYGGTKTEMERLLADAEKLTGQKYDISNLSDVYNAIHAVQEELSITGTTADEAMKTIEGSVNATKAAWQNFLVGLGDEDADLDQLVENLVTSAKAALDNIVPRIGQVLKSLGKVMVNGLKDAFTSIDSNAFNGLGEKIINGIKTMAPKVLQGLTNMFNMAAQALPSIISSFASKIVEALNSLSDIIANGGTGGLGALISAILNAAWEVTKALLAALPSMLMAVANLSITLISTLQQSIVSFVVNNIPDAIATILSTAVSLIKALITTLGKVFTTGMGKSLSNAWKTIASSVAKAFTPMITSIVQKFNEMKNKVSEKWQAIKDVVKEKLSPAFNFNPLNTFMSLMEKVKDAWASFKGYIKSKISTAVNVKALQTLQKWIDKIKKAWNNLKSLLRKAIAPRFSFGAFSTLQSWINKAKGWWDSLRSKLSNAIHGSISVSKSGSVNGNYPGKRIGLKEVPYDNYKASLHKGEVVLTAAEANMYKMLLQKNFNTDTKEPRTIIQESQPTTTYNFGNITVDVSKLKDLTTVEQFVDMMLRAKQFA